MAAAATTLLASACIAGGSTSPSATAVASGASRSAGSVATPAAGNIPQPPLSKLNRRTRRRLAPASRRVDLAIPSFSHPATITNPLFPISDLTSTVLVGRLNGRAWLAETTLLPGTRPVDWNGRRVRTRESQFVAYLDGRIFEVAVDHYAQADDGSVWYFGEDAYTYERGRISDTEGTWLAGVTAPPAMIMPAHPHVGDVYRTENIPNLVFEQVTVKKVGQKVRGPTGPVRGAMVGRELHMDEPRLEDKTFAPGYGEFLSGEGKTYEATALAVPVDAASGPIPAGLRSLLSEAIRAFDAARSGGWRAAAASTTALRTRWRGLRSEREPYRLAAEMDGALHRLGGAVGRRDSRAAAMAAIEVARIGLDLQLRYGSSARVNVARLGLWALQLQADAAAKDRMGVIGDAATMEWVRDRIPLGATATRVLDEQLQYVQGAAESGEFVAASDAAMQLRDVLAGLRPLDP
jgi:hypothetical protein